MLGFSEKVRPSLNSNRSRYTIEACPIRNAASVWREGRDACASVDGVSENVRRLTHPVLGSLSLMAALTIPFACTLGEEDDESGAGSAAGSGGRSADSTTADANGECSPDANDDACSACLKAKCCAEWTNCRADTTCTTCTDCLARELRLDACNFTASGCQFEGTEDPAAEILICGLAACEIECGFS